MKYIHVKMCLPISFILFLHFFKENALFSTYIPKGLKVEKNEIICDFTAKQNEKIRGAKKTSFIVLIFRKSLVCFQPMNFPPNISRWIFPPDLILMIRP